MTRPWRSELVVEQQFGIVQQAADQGRLAVVDAAAGDEAQQRLALRRFDPGFQLLRCGFGGLDRSEQGGH